MPTLENMLPVTWAPTWPNALYSPIGISYRARMLPWNSGDCASGLPERPNTFTIGPVSDCVIGLPKFALAGLLLMSEGEFCCVLLL